MPGTGLQQPERHRIVDLGVPEQVSFQFGDLHVVVVDQGQVGSNHQLRARIAETRRDLVAAIAGVGQLLGQRRQVELRSWY